MNIWLFFIIIGTCTSCTHRPPWFTSHKAEKSLSEKPFVIIVPSYNNREWYEYNLSSVLLQKYKNYRIIYIDDNSSDQTGCYVQAFIKKHKIKNITFIQNRQRVGALANIWHSIQLTTDHEIIINLDGDDWFSHDQVLKYLNKIYQSPNVWLTYGQFQNWPTKKNGWCKEIPQEIIAQNNFRSHGFCFAQPRTYYAWLAKKIKNEDLIDEQTKTFYKVAGDVALMFPLVEMAGLHIKFINEILCVRNVKNPLNDFKINLEEQLNITQLIANQPSYKPLTNVREVANYDGTIMGSFPIST
ncbi:TPA: hypothetical protein DIC20_04250 [Candidatus Dependentiae bacterium]|nr:MAG: hypothetical protein US03_C0004G0051 [candidate division TM6 bacterium GW2011_GWF2_36_131]KKQ03229.1 MAG: hypothetical protein US13_C0004G0051 [candidate division TM6 bacterium GW2011_GWE2_36_25]KKQ19820.1 MAG: hypothetical protein US32_C0004G0004 [candidate division TM6 bacterium GW2011_GWA2_36_9]HBR70341.1 hypothetical protein [Candidatus Dependentiae bacterium]HCU00886.1 hypothetical protein [Candidatus Dependentiae bacterium]